MLSIKEVLVMARSVNVNFRMDEQLKKNVEDICQRMGMNLTTLLTICCRKIEQERRIPFDITADPDPFYSESNISYLKKKLDALEAGDLPLEEHDLIEVDSAWAGGCSGTVTPGRTTANGRRINLP